MNRIEITAELFETMTRMKRSMHSRMQLLAESLEISQSQLEVLFTIHRMQPVSAKQIAQHMGMTAGAISQLLDGLDKTQLISRTTDAKDRRSQALEISLHGREQLQLIEKQRHEVMKHILDGMDTDELQFLLKVQKKIVTAMQNLSTINPIQETK